MTKSIGIWIRVSTEDQKLGESPEHHEKRARYYAESKGWEIKEVYHLEAVSGKSVIAHPETQRMLNDIKEKKITGLIFSKLARLARNTKELLDFSEIFRKYNADLISLQESIDTSSPAGRLFYTMIAAMAQWEREEISERVAASVPIRAKLGKPLGGQAPFGYQWVDKKLIIDKKEAPIRKLIYELFIEHERKRTVARILNERGYRTRNGSNFSGTTIERLLTDPIAKGKHRSNYTRSLGKGRKWEEKENTEWIYNDIEPLISEETWNRCNNIITEQKKKYKKPTKKVAHLFTGIVYCHCNNKMYVPSNSPKYICYNCRNKIEENDLEEIYYGEIKNFLLSPKAINHYLANANTSLKNKQKLLNRTIEERSKIIKEMDKLVKLHIDGELPNEGFGRHYKPLEERLAQIDSQLPELQGEIDYIKIQYISSDEILTEAMNIYSNWSKLKHDEKRHIIETFTEKIIVEKNEITIDFSFSPTREKLMTDKPRNFKDS